MSLHDRFHLSHTGRNLYRSCERKWLLAPLSGRDVSLHTEFGSALGAAFQKWAVTQSLELATLELMQWWTWQFDDSRNKKTFWTGLRALEMMIDEFPRHEFRVWNYKGKPATELGFQFVMQERIEAEGIPEISYIGFIDIVLERISDGSLVVCDVKTTGDNKRPDVIRAKYGNDAQLPGYQIVVQSMAPDRKCDEVIYDVAQFANAHQPVTHFMRFDVRADDRREFLLTLLMDREQILRNVQYDHWPMRGDACASRGRQCQHYGTCGLASILEQARKVERSAHIPWNRIAWRGNVEQLVREQL